MAMEGVSSCLAALLFLTLLLTANGGGDHAAAAAAAAVEEEHPLVADDEPYMLATFLNKDGEEIRLLADKGSEILSASGFAIRSGHWFYAIRQGNGGKRRRRLPLAQSISNNMLVVVADQRYFFITGFAQGFFRTPNWFFRDGERHRLLMTSLGNGSSHAEVIASNALAAV